MWPGTSKKNNKTEKRAQLVKSICGSGQNWSEFLQEWVGVGFIKWSRAHLYPQWFKLFSHTLILEGFWTKLWGSTLSTGSTQQSQNANESRIFSSDLKLCAVGMRLQSAVELQLRGHDGLKAKMGGSSCSLWKSIVVIGPRPGRKGIQEGSKNYPSVSDMLGKLKKATCIQRY